jgi:uncharacterized protein (TIGR00661 family)
MANILYGVNGEGSGHSTRAQEVLSHLKDRGHTLHVASFDRGLRNLQGKFEVTEIHGLRLAYVNNQVRYERTLAKNLMSVRKRARSVALLSDLVDAWKIDLVITDFEPLSCHVGHRKRLPVISIDNQHCLTNTQVSYPGKYRREAALTKLVTRVMTPRADAYLVTSFFGSRITRPRTFLFPPILRQQILNAAPMKDEHILVYVTSPVPALAKLLGSVRSPFIAYGFGREGRIGNVLFKKPSLDVFLEDLTGAKAIVANAGFSLITEALYLGKPYLAIPMKHQFEQIFNAYWIDTLGYGRYWDELNKERVESFLYNLPQYNERLNTYPRKGNAALLQKLDALIAGYTQTPRAAVSRWRK